MKRLDLDFQRRPVASPAGWVLLALGVAAGAAALVAGQRIGEERALHEAKARHIEQSLPKVARTAQGAGAPGRIQDAGLAGMRSVLSQLDLPWNDLFNTLESNAVGDVALLSLTPDARKGQVRLMAEARDLGAMLLFHRRLEESGRLRDVSLVNHELGEQVPGRPVRFSLVATWVVDNANR